MHLSIRNLHATTTYLCDLYDQLSNNTMFLHYCIHQASVEVNSIYIPIRLMHIEEENNLLPLNSQN